MTKKKSNYRYEYYHVEIPEEIDDPEERARLAFIQAEEMTRIWRMPCTWAIISDDGYNVKVCRMSNK